MLRGTKTGHDESWQLTYNALNQVTGADITTSSGATTVNYAYDHDGIRIAKTVDGTDVTRYLVDKNRLKLRRIGRICLP